MSVNLLRRDRLEGGQLLTRDLKENIYRTQPVQQMYITYKYVMLIE